MAGKSASKAPAAAHADTAARAKEKDLDTDVREELARILKSGAFEQADRLKRFLMFIVNEAAAGRRTELKEYVIGVQVFRKEDSFDPRTDPIVRVQARRLRARLVRYYREEGRGDSLVIELPKGGYAPVFKRRDTPVLARRTISTATKPTGPAPTMVPLPFSP